MHSLRTLATLAALGLVPTFGACSTLNRRTTTVESAGEVAGAATVTTVTPSDNRTLPIGAALTATLDHALGTKISIAGDPFTATVSSSLSAQNGSVVVPAGAKVEGHVTALDPSDNATDPALIRLTFDHLRFNGRSYPLSAEIVQSSPVQTSGQSSAQRTKQIVIGGAVGAALGAIVGGSDLDKIVLGGALGAAVGSIISLGTEVNATLPAGSQMTMRVTQAIVLR